MDTLPTPQYTITPLTPEQRTEGVVAEVDFRDHTAQLAPGVDGTPRATRGSQRVNIYQRDVTPQAEQVEQDTGITAGTAGVSGAEAAESPEEAEDREQQRKAAYTRYRHKSGILPQEIGGDGRCVLRLTTLGEQTEYQRLDPHTSWRKAREADRFTLVVPANTSYRNPKTGTLEVRTYQARVAPHSTRRRVEDESNPRGFTYEEVEKGSVVLTCNISTSTEREIPGDGASTTKTTEVKIDTAVEAFTLLTPKQIAEIAATETPPPLSPKERARRSWFGGLAVAAVTAIVIGGSLLVPGGSVPHNASPSVPRQVTITAPSNVCPQPPLGTELIDIDSTPEGSLWAKVEDGLIAGDPSLANDAPKLANETKAWVTIDQSRITDIPDYRQIGQPKREAIYTAQTMSYVDQYAAANPGGDVATALKVLESTAATPQQIDSNAASRRPEVMSAVGTVVTAAKRIGRAAVACAGLIGRHTAAA